MTLCEHVYKETVIGDCPSCGKPSHTMDWKEQLTKFLAKHNISNTDITLLISTITLICLLFGKK